MIKNKIFHTLQKFPKERPPLPKELELIHVSHYHKNREGETPITSLTQKMESWLHRKVAFDVAGIKQPHIANITTLELGAGSLNQLPYEPIVGPYDIVEPFVDLYKNKPSIERIRNRFTDISEIQLIPQYNRVTSIATLEHILNLPEVIAKSGLILKNGGCFRAAIPNEGSLLWTLGWKFTTGIEFRIKYGLDYAKIMAHEHVNTSEEIIDVAKFFYEEVKIKSFGINRWLSFYIFLECKTPNIERCKSYLHNIQKC